MRKRLMLAAAAVLAALVFWRLWPLSFRAATGIQEAQTLVALAMVNRVEDADPYFALYKLEKPREQDVRAIMDILEGGRYRQDLRNALPWFTYSAGSDMSELNLHLSVQTAEGTGVSVYFADETLMAVCREPGAGYRLYHPTNRATLEDLADYLRGHGEKEESRP